MPVSKKFVDARLLELSSTPRAMWGTRDAVESMVITLLECEHETLNVLRTYTEVVGRLYGTNGPVANLEPQTDSEFIQKLLEVAKRVRDSNDNTLLGPV